MILREIICNRKTCNNKFKEERFNQGFKGWGHIAGDLRDDKTGETTPHLCPECMNIIKRFLNGEDIIK